jgi:hypothetical protein
MTYDQEKAYLAGEREAEIAALRQSTQLTFSVESELAVVGHDPEYADMENPTGEIIRNRYFMVATTPEGRQYRWGWERSAVLAEAVFQMIAPPVSEWSLWRCVYGSLAYEQDNCELETLAEELETDLGPHWMTQAHPMTVARIYGAGVR